MHKVSKASLSRPLAVEYTHELVYIGWMFYLLAPNVASPLSMGLLTLRTMCLYEVYSFLGNIYEYYKCIIHRSVVILVK